MTVSADGVRLFHESIAAEKSGDKGLSYQLLLASINEDDTLPGAWNNLGVRLHEQKKWAAAAAAFYRSYELAPQSMQTYANYAWNLHHAGRKDEALACMGIVIEKEPNDVKHWVNYSQVNLSLNKIDEALRAARRAHEINPDDTMARLSLALSLLRNGQYQEGLRYYEARFPYVPVLSEYLKYPYPMWRGEDISQKRLFIACEQGLGDSIMFLRFIPEAVKRAKKVIVYVHDSAFTLFRRSLPQSVELHAIPKEIPAADVFCPLISLPVALQLTNEQLSNSYKELKTLDAPVQLPKTERKKIGICWAGDPNHDNDRSRSAKLDNFLSLAESNGIQLYSLQVGPRAQDTDLLGTHAVVNSLTPYLKSASDTMSIMRQMDAVVTVDTSTAHMAASVGVKTYTLIAKYGVDWRWGKGDGHTIWYPDMTLVQQMVEGSWKEPIEKVKELLQ